MTAAQTSGDGAGARDEEVFDGVDERVPTDALRFGSDVLRHFDHRTGSGQFDVLIARPTQGA